MKDYETARSGLINFLRTEITDKHVLDVMSRVSRELFVPEVSRSMAYEDKPLPIGSEQTISQPYIIAFMTESLKLTGSEKVLEIGTGSGYQTAILAELAAKVISVERIPSLLKTAGALLNKLGYKNIETYEAEEELGWKKGAPYDAIMVTAGAPAIPQELVNQLAMEGRMVIPAGSRYVQDLYKVSKDTDGIHVEKLGGCRFVALIGKDAWQN
jgi:protein-L-isoaspartate(D-aspartate) O-methyltransferase